MSASQLPSYWEQAEIMAFPNDVKEFLPVYLECTIARTVPSPPGQSPRMTLHSIKSAIWSYLKGDIYYKHHPTFTQDRYFNAMMKGQRMNN